LKFSEVAEAGGLAAKSADYVSKRAELERKLREVKKMIAAAKGHKYLGEEDSARGSARLEGLNAQKKELEKQIDGLKKRMDSIDIEIRLCRQGTL
jgi:chromosome segregation ATPase